FSRDWSSDVCSSDLHHIVPVLETKTHAWFVGKKITSTNAVFKSFVLGAVGNKAFQFQMFAEIIIGYSSKPETISFNIIKTKQSEIRSEIKIANGLITCNKKRDDIHISFVGRQSFDGVNHGINFLFSVVERIMPCFIPEFCIFIQRAFFYYNILCTFQKLLRYRLI